ncbi:MAG: hypothetical protein AB8B99_18615 [Phormidesmis sp.]
MLTYMGDRIVVSGFTVWLLSALFIVLFFGLPLLVYRYNWLNVRSLLSCS